MKYLGYYDVKAGRRNVFLSAVNKMNYIINAINRVGQDVEVVSCSMVSDKKYPEKDIKINEQVKVHLFKTHTQGKNIVDKMLKIIKNNIILFCYLLKKVKKNEQIIVYHSLGTMRCIYWVKKLIGFKLILEVEEFYNDVSLKSKSSRKMEKKFIECADKYIFPTKLLNDKFNTSNKPYVIIHGTYLKEEDRNASFGDGKIHVVYAGTFDPRKGGAMASTEAAEWLPENFHIHILGFGEKKETELIKKIIEETDGKAKATVTYDGLLEGEEYIEFLQKCQIGLSTQNPYADFNATSFPSKILSYMANGLRVVSVRIPAIETSDVGQVVYYYEEQNPQMIAEAILNIDFEDGYSGRKKIDELDEKCIKNLKELIGEC